MIIKLEYDELNNYYYLVSLSSVLGKMAIFLGSNKSFLQQPVKRK